MGLPSDLNNREMDELHEEMGTVLKRILLRLSDRISGMKVSNVEQKILQQRQRGLLRTATSSSIGMIVNDIVKDITAQYQTRRRRLEQDITLYFNVYVVRDYDKKFGPLVIQEIRDSYEEVLEQIQAFADTKYFGSNLNLNWCTTQNGKYDLCVKDVNNGSSGARPMSQMPIQNGNASSNSGEGLAGWAISLIVIIALIVLGCAGYWIAVVCFGVTNCFRYNHENDIQSHIYFDDNQSQFDVVSRYGSRGSRRTDKSTINNNRRIAKDPTMYIPGQYDKPDPLTDGSSRSSGRSSRGSAGRNGRRRYYEDDNSAPIRPKREPTMYVDGERTIDEEYSVDYPASLKSASRQTNPKRSYYNDDNRGGIHSVLDENESYRTEEYEAPPSRRGRDYYGEGNASFLTEDPSYATRSEARSKKKSSRSSRRSDRDYY